jgi:hypothetical protein
MEVKNGGTEGGWRNREERRMGILSLLSLLSLSHSFSSLPS